MTGSLRAILAKLLIFAVFTSAITGLLAAVIGNIQPFTRFYDVDAIFSDATGLLENDVVRIAGVDVGKVTGAEVGETGNARVHLQVREDVKLPENVRASIRFRNLLGQRQVILSRDPDRPNAPPLPTDGSAEIPVDQTSPSFDLGIVFNNVQPALANLNPEDANTLTRATVEIFRGREERVQALVEDLADLSETLGERGPVAADLIRDLDTVVGSLAERDDELRSILASFDSFLRSLASRSTELGGAVENMDDVSNGYADLIAKHRAELTTAIAQLRDVLAIAEAHKGDLDATIRGLAGPDGTTHALNRATTYGNAFNLVGVCVNNVCGSGFPNVATDSGLADIFGSATGEDR